MCKRDTVKWHILLIAAVMLLTGVGIVRPEFDAEDGVKILYFTAGYQKSAPTVTARQYPDSLAHHNAHIVASLPAADTGGAGEALAVLPERGRGINMDAQPVCTQSGSRSGFVSTNKKVFYLLI